MCSEPDHWLHPRQVIQDLGLSPLRSLGQNFMVDRSVLQAIVRCAELDIHKDLVVEIGPGTGALTQYFLAQGVQVCCIELDRGLADHLEQSYGGDQCRVIHGDVLHKKRNWNQDLWSVLNRAKGEGRQLKWISNLPYNILTPLLWNMLESYEIWDLGIFLVQKEFAERLHAPSGTSAYGPLAVISHLCLNVRSVRGAPRGCFWPAPEVDSAVIVVSKKSDVMLMDVGFKDFLRQVFSQRRKTLAKLIANKYDKAKVREALLNLSYPEDARAESLAPEDLLLLYRSCIEA